MEQKESYSVLESQVTLCSGVLVDLNATVHTVAVIIMRQLRSQPQNTKIKILMNNVN